jgi:molybdopterin adenylyltransferase
VRTAVLTISTSLAGGEGEDRSGPALAQHAREAGCEVDHEAVVPDDRARIAAALGELRDAGYAVVLTTGGTGFTPDDVTPEATGDVVDRDAPGIAEALRAASLEHTPMAMLSRGRAGIAGGTLIVNFPGSPRAIEQTFGVLAPVLGHAVATLSRSGGRSHGG